MWTPSSPSVAIRSTTVRGGGHDSSRSSRDADADADAAWSARSSIAHTPPPTNVGEKHAGGRRDSHTMGGVHGEGDGSACAQLVDDDGDESSRDDSSDEASGSRAACGPRSAKRRMRTGRRTSIALSPSLTHGQAHTLPNGLMACAAAPAAAHSADLLAPAPLALPAPACPSAPRSGHGHADPDPSLSPTPQQHKKQRRRLGFSVFVDPNDHPDGPNHVLRHLTLDCSADAVPLRERCLRLTELLSSHPLFRSLSPELTRRIFREFVRERREAGSVLFAAGSVSDTFYLIDSGEICCEYEQGAAPRRRRATEGAAGPTVLRKQASDTLGDLALMQPCATPQPFTARVDLLGPAALYSIDGCIFRYLMQHGMQLRYQQLKTFFRSLSLFPSGGSELIENLIEGSTILEFAQGDVIVPSGVRVPPRPDSARLQSPPPLRLAAADDNMMECVTSPAPLDCPSTHSCLISPCALDRGSSVGSAFSSSLGVSLSAFTPAPPASSPAPSPLSHASTSVVSPSPPPPQVAPPPAEPLPSYLSHCVFFVQSGTVSVSRPLAGTSDSSSSHDAEQPTVTSTLSDKELFGLEILSCPHRLLEQAALPVGPRTPPLMSPVFGSTVVTAPPTACVSATASTAPSVHASPKSSRKRLRGSAESDASVSTALDDLTSPLHFSSALPPVALAPSWPPVSFTPVSSSPVSSVSAGPDCSDAAASLSAGAALDALVGSCACRGEVRCASGAAIVIAVDANVWKTCILQSI